MNGKPFNQDKAMLKEAHTNTVNNKSKYYPLMTYKLKLQ